MEHPGFYERAGPFALDAVARHLAADVTDSSALELRLEDVRALGDAGPNHLSFIDNRKYLDALAGTKAGACLVAGPSGTSSAASGLAVTISRLRQ